MSEYEDALDESDDELRKLCRDAARHLNHAELRLKKSGPTPTASTFTTIPSGGNGGNGAPKKRLKTAQYSSSENSSVERIANDAPFRSRQGTTTTTKRQNGRAAVSTSSNENGDDWRHVNFAFQEATCYPIIFQLNQQLQILSSQLHDMETTNVLQLKLVYRVMKIALKARRRSWLASSTGITFIGWIFLFSWPVILQILYNFYKKYYWM